MTWPEKPKQYEIDPPAGKEETQYWEDAMWLTIGELSAYYRPYTQPEWEDKEMHFFLASLRGIMDEIMFYYQQETSESGIFNKNDESYRYWFKNMFTLAWQAVFDYYPPRFLAPHEDVNDKILADLGNLVIRKQHDYGHKNILSFGIHGIVIRVHDKIVRLENLFGKGREAANEAVEDSLFDLMGYSLMAMMVIDKTFSLPMKIDQ